MAYSPDGRFIATGAELRTLPNQVDSVNDVAFSSDGKRLIIGGQATRVFDVRTWDEIVTIVAKGSELALSRDNTRLYVAPWTGGVAGYILPLEAAIELAESRLTRWFTPDECRQYLHTETCPPRPQP